ncbi:V8-like Glu-specific endopeptidase [Roseivivax lentus]|uniref:Serine protease n=1 Tax=Roseivivax lentus TaxID=633194 RepID=A0A1N7NP47_9RHOB|nr:serine protease [Roseivivax lentus]SIT00185.1 V8-like Glu-specific endopeptidase [Roseivivax lentus]
MLDLFDIFKDADPFFSGPDRFDPAIIGADDRTLVRNTRVMPYAAICYIERSFGGRKFGCSGTLIAPNLVLTAGHCLIKRDGRVPVTMNIQPGRNGDDRLETIPAERAWVARGFAQKHQPLFDYGLIKLTRPVRNPRAVIPPHQPSNAMLRALSRRGRIRVVGYPSDKPRATMWTHSERLHRFDRRRLIHVVDTCPGHSGSAVLAFVNGKLRVIGIHVAGVRDPRTGRSYGCTPGTAGSPEGGYNRAVRLSPRVMAAIRGERNLGDYSLMRVWPRAG